MAGRGRPRRHLLPQRDDLFRQAHPAAPRGALRPPAAPARALLRGPCREPARPGTVLPATRADGLCAGDPLPNPPPRGWERTWDEVSRNGYAVIREDDPLRDEQPNRYFDPHFKVETAKILPGEYYATNKDMALVTVLGSCVSACLRDRESGIGGMNHFMLPDEGKLVGTHGNISAGGRYGVHAMELLINQILKLGGRRERLEAKVFGGGNVLQGFMLSNVGQQNAEFIVEYLNMERIPIAARDLLDVWPRKIYFFPRSGKVMVKRLRKVNNDTIVLRERDYGARLFHGPIEGGAELFK